jgi:hypothetical protein
MKKSLLGAVMAALVVAASWHFASPAAEAG